MSMSTYTSSVVTICALVLLLVAGVSAHERPPAKLTALDLIACHPHTAELVMHGRCRYNDCWVQLLRKRTGGDGERTLHMPVADGTPCVAGMGACLDGSCVRHEDYDARSRYTTYNHTSELVKSILEEDMATDVPYCGPFNVALGFDDVYCVQEGVKVNDYYHYDIVKSSAKERCQGEDADASYYDEALGRYMKCLCSAVDAHPCEGRMPATAMSFDEPLLASPMTHFPEFSMI